MLRYDRIVLTGFMGSGKTTVGKVLAERLGWTFIDLDDAVEALAGQAVPAIFADHGEPHFRALESEALASVVADTHVVIALGGGAIETESNRRALAAAPRTAIVLLQAPFAMLYSRCLSQSANDASATARPNLASRDAAEVRYARRAPLYGELAEHTLDVSAESPADLATELLQKLRASDQLDDSFAAASSASASGSV